jgi:hypothetical protein
MLRTSANGPGLWLPEKVPRCAIKKDVYVTESVTNGRVYLRSEGKSKNGCDDSRWDLPVGSAQAVLGVDPRSVRPSHSLVDRRSVFRLLS